MSGHWKDYWQELHHGEEEYCRRSGPLNSRKISAAKPKNTILANGMGLVTSAAAAIGLAAVIAALYITSAPVMITGNSASVNVNVHNRQENQQVEYVLVKEEDPDIPIESGIIGPDEDQLEFDNLESNTSYVVEYFVENDGERQKVGEFRFTTDGPVEGGPPTPPTTDPPPVSSEEVTDPPEATTSEEETTTSEEETSEQLEETTEEEETSQEESSEEETTTQSRPTQPRPTESQPTEPEPTQPKPTQPRPTESETTESETPETGTTAPEGADPSQDIQVSAELVLAEPAMNDDWVVSGYRCTERHTFTNVSSGEAIITATQGGQPMTYQMSYNAGTRTMVIEFMGDEIPVGQSATSLVTIEDVDGRTATSSLTIQTPALNSLSMTVTPNGDGSYAFALSSGVTQPSHGSLSFEAWIYSGAEEMTTENFTGTGNTVTHEVSMHVPGIGMVYAYADLYAVWSLQPEDTERLYIGLDDELGYETGAGSSLTFELHEGTYTDNSGAEISYYPYPYEYDVHAVFNGLGNIRPLYVEFMRTIATRYLTDDLTYGYEYGDWEPVATVEELTVGEDGAIRADYQMPDQTNYADYGDSLFENERHEWTASLTYVDANGNEQQVFLDDYIECPEYSDARNDGILRRLDDGSYEAELDLKFNILGGSHGGVVLDYVQFNSNNANGEKLQVKEWTMKDGVLRVIGTAPEFEGFDYSYNVYGYWALANRESNRTTGNSVVFMTPSHVYKSSPVWNEESGEEYFETTETYIFANADEAAFATMTVEVSDPDNVKDMEVTFHEESGEIQVYFVRTNQQMESWVTSEITVNYKSGYLDEEGVLHNEESRRIETYERYQVLPQ